LQAAVFLFDDVVDVVLDEHPTTRAHEGQSVEAAQCVGDVLRFVRWIEEHAVEARSLRREACQGLVDAGSENAGVRSEARGLQVRLENCNRRRRLLDEGRARGAAAERFDPQRSAAGEQIEELGAGEFDATLEDAEELP
jgi:hypothetical protein